MKQSKDFQKVIGEYKHGLYDIQIGIDNTDHIVFLCPKCNKPMRVIKVRSENIIIDFKKNKDNCSWITLVCDNCKRLGQRKFYWTSEDGKYCYQRT